jgi:hypothetical protein
MSQKSSATARKYSAALELLPILSNIIVFLKDFTADKTTTVATPLGISQLMNVVMILLVFSAESSCYGSRHDNRHFEYTYKTVLQSPIFYEAPVKNLYAATVLAASAPDPTLTNTVTKPTFLQQTKVNIRVR